MTESSLEAYFAHLYPEPDEFSERDLKLRRWTHLGGAYCLLFVLKEADRPTKVEVLSSLEGLDRHLRPRVTELVRAALPPGALDAEHVEDLITVGLWGALHLGLLLKEDDPSLFRGAIDEINAAFPDTARSVH